MKLLVDTSAWSVALRRQESAILNPAERKLKEALAQAVQDGRVAMIGAIRQELLSGIKYPSQFEKMKAALAPFADEQVQTADHEYAAQLYNECRSQGLEAGPIDMLICAVAIKRGWDVLSNDDGLNRCLEAGRRLQKSEEKSSLKEVAALPSKKRRTKT